MLFETQIQGIPIDLQRQLEDGAGARKAWNEIGMVELNAMLFRSNGEEIDARRSHLRALPGKNRRTDVFFRLISGR